MNEKQQRAQRNVEPFESFVGADAEELSPERDELKRSQPEEWHEAASGYRDIAGSGGRAVPGTAGQARTDNPSSGMNTTESGLEGDIPENADLNQTMPSPSRRNTIDRHARGNLGGRNPGEPQTSMGARDVKNPQGDHGDETSDPMTGRAPDQLA